MLLKRLHYTTADGLKGIIEKNDLWANSAYFLNDSAEITYGYGLLKEVLANWLGNNPRSDNEAFKVEKEWRIVVRQRELTKQGTDDGGTTPIPLQFRTAHGMVVPHVKLIPTDPAKKLPIECVRTGPMLDKTIAGMGVDMMLEKNGFPTSRCEAPTFQLDFSLSQFGRFSIAGVWQFCRPFLPPPIRLAG